MITLIIHIWRTYTVSLLFVLAHNNIIANTKDVEKAVLISFTTIHDISPFQASFKMYNKKQYQNTITEVLCIKDIVSEDTI